MAIMLGLPSPFITTARPRLVNFVGVSGSLSELVTWRCQQSSPWLATHTPADTVSRSREPQPDAAR
jgi:hypothetical protein